MGEKKQNKNYVKYTWREVQAYCFLIFIIKFRSREQMKENAHKS